MFSMSNLMVPQYPLLTPFLLSEQETRNGGAVECHELKLQNATNLSCNLLLQQLFTYSVTPDHGSPSDDPKRDRQGPSSTIS